VRKRKMSTLMEQIGEEADGIVNNARVSLDSLIKVLQGITMQSADSSYQPLTNMQQITGKTAEFADGLNGTIEMLQRALKLMEEIHYLEDSDA
jgi:hypothetical protein